ncbi:MAG: prephenate dehydrogenase/arogenate dehydrogenase family protein [Planctomycetes bacterium]|nr:prephenate dehydrogenase/arogenate dehydrogenase family protein [Planctomycetota bacterium]NBY02464.1 prephenate dehydrogenase/arogenate dehydrogenase family protein [Planctomycetota bacterium]
MVETLGLIGTGMIGGSIGLACKKAGHVKRIIGYDTNPESLEASKALGICDSIEYTLEDAVKHADLVIFSMPVHSIAEEILQAAKYAREGVVFTDTGSTKAEICSLVKEKIKGLKPVFVPAHPIAGSEKNGPTAAHAELFKGKLTILCPLENTPAWALDKVATFWQGMGARIEKLSPEEHDKIFAFTSHLPHLIAYALAGLLEPKHVQFTAGGFRDTTRVAGSDPALWAEIFKANKGPLLEALKGFQEGLHKIESCLKSNDFDALKNILTKAQQFRRKVQ